MYPDCRCDDALGSLTFVGSDRFTAPLDELLDPPDDDDLGALAYTDDTGVDLGSLEVIDLDLADDDDTVDGFSDYLKAGAAVLDRLAGGGGSKNKARNAQRAANRERQRADELQREVERQRRRTEQAEERQRIAQSRQADAARRREMAELEQRVANLRDQQALVRSRMNQQKAAQRKRLTYIGGGLLLLGAAAAGVRAMSRRSAP